jgi:exosortase
VTTPLPGAVGPQRRTVPDWRTGAPILATGLAFFWLFWQPASTLIHDWWTSDDAGYGLLLAPLALVLAWRRGRVPGSRPQPGWGLSLIVAAVVLRYVSGLAAESFTMRLSLVGAGAGLVVLYSGWRQIGHWWLPGILVLLAIPLPAVVLGSLALPLQLQATELGAGLLQWRDVPVFVAGNVIHLPGQSLFVTEACSGLRSLSALLAIGVLIGGLWLRSPVSRAAIVLAAVPVAVLLNGVRIFLTGFLVHFVSPGMGEGLMHYSKGWTLFLVAFLILGGLAWLTGRLERLAPRALLVTA